MDLRHLRTFVTVAEQRTVSKAAFSLHVAQPALSRQISDLERELGIKLFDRVRKRLVLTGEGERLLTDCRHILSAVNSLGEHAEQLRRADAGVLKVSATPQMIDGVFSTFLHRYSAHFPHVQVKLREAFGNELFATLERGEVHLCVALQYATQPESEEFESFSLPPLEFLAAGHEALRLGSRGKIEIASLVAFPLLLLETSFGVRQTFDAACRLAELRPEIFIESRTPHALLSLAEAGHGVAIVPSNLPTHRYRLQVARLTHQHRLLRGAVKVMWNRRRVLPPYAKSFCELLSAHMREVLPISQPSARSTPRTKRAFPGRA